MKFEYIKEIALGSILALATSVVGAADKEIVPVEMVDIVETAASTGTFTTLLAALDAADKTKMLKEDGPFTVFAPNDEAFAKLPEGTVTDLLKPENKGKLGKLLAYHVLKGKEMASDVKDMMAETANGAKLDIKVNDEGVTVNGARVITADVAASNGVIHVIDTVLIPPTEKPAS